jgi:hypothetical protein
MTRRCTTRPDFTAELLRADVVELECNLRGLTNSYGTHSFEPPNALSESKGQLSAASSGESAMESADDCSSEAESSGEDPAGPSPEVKARESAQQAAKRAARGQPSDGCEDYEEWREYYERTEKPLPRWEGALKEWVPWSEDPNNPNNAYP